MRYKEYATNMIDEAIDLRDHSKINASILSSYRIALSKFLTEYLRNIGFYDGITDYKKKYDLFLGSYEVEELKKETKKLASIYLNVILSRLERYIEVDDSLQNDEDSKYDPMKPELRKDFENEIKKIKDTFIRLGIPK
jgi:hypothetical protein